MSKIVRPRREDGKKQVKHDCGWYAWVMLADKEATVAEHVRICGTVEDILHGPTATLDLGI